MMNPETNQPAPGGAPPDDARLRTIGLQMSALMAIFWAARLLGGLAFRAWFAARISESGGEVHGGSSELVAAVVSAAHSSLNVFSSGLWSAVPIGFAVACWDGRATASPRARVAFTAAAALWGLYACGGVLVDIVAVINALRFANYGEAMRAAEQTLNGVQTWLQLPAALASGVTVAALVLGRRAASAQAIAGAALLGAGLVWAFDVAFLRGLVGMASRIRGVPGFDRLLFNTTGCLVAAVGAALFAADLPARDDAPVAPMGWVRAGEGFATVRSFFLARIVAGIALGLLGGMLGMGAASSGSLSGLRESTVILVVVSLVVQLVIGVGILAGMFRVAQELPHGATRVLARVWWAWTLALALATIPGASEFIGAVRYGSGVLSGLTEQARAERFTQLLSFAMMALGAVTMTRVAARARPDQPLTGADVVIGLGALGTVLMVAGRMLPEHGDMRVLGLLLVVAGAVPALIALFRFLRMLREARERLAQPSWQGG